MGEGCGCTCYLIYLTNYRNNWLIGLKTKNKPLGNTLKQYLMEGPSSVPPDPPSVQ